MPMHKALVAGRGLGPMIHRASLSAAWEKESASFAAPMASRYGCSFFRFAWTRASLAARAFSRFATSGLTGTESYANAMRCGPTADKKTAAVTPRSRRLRHGREGETASATEKQRLRRENGRHDRRLRRFILVGVFFCVLVLLLGME
jgi:hypothetical protein